MKILFILLLCASTLRLSAQEYNKSLFAENFNTVYAFESLDSFTPVAGDKSYIRMFNNSENLAIQVVAVDKTTQAIFIINGLSLYIDINGARSQRYALNFPKANNASLPTALQGTDNADEILNQWVQRMTTTLSQRPARLQTPREITELDRNSAGLYFDNTSGALVYTVELPLNKLGGDIGNRNSVNVGLSSQFESLSITAPGGGQVTISPPTGEVFDPSMMEGMTMRVNTGTSGSSGSQPVSIINLRDIMSGMMVWVPFETD